MKNINYFLNKTAVSNQKTFMGDWDGLDRGVTDTLVDDFHTM